MVFVMSSFVFSFSSFAFFERFFHLVCGSSHHLFSSSLISHQWTHSIACKPQKPFLLQSTHTPLSLRN